MSAILSAFGIDWRVLVIDTINFGIVLFALWYFLYGPLVRMIEERRLKVAQGVHDAEEAARKVAEIDASRAEKLAQAGKEADDVLSKARAAGNEKNRELVAQGEAAAARIVSDAEAQAREAKERAIAESREEVAKLVVLGIEKAIMQKK